MKKSHAFTCEAQWYGTLRHGVGELTAATFSHAFSVPQEMGGAPLGTNPEDLLVASANACYIMTLAALLDAEGVPYGKLSNHTKGIFDLTPQGPVLSALHHTPCVTLTREARLLFGGLVQSCMLQAEANCMVSKALDQSIRMAITVQGVIETTQEGAAEAL